MAESGREAVRRVAAALSDGQPVDWDALEASRSLTESEIGALRLLETIRTGTQRQPTEPRPANLGLEIQDEIGGGAASRVHRAVDRALGRPVAVKIVRRDAIVPEAARERFISEARALASIDHPNVVRIHSIDEDDGDVRLCLEFIDGRTLERIVEDDGPLAPEEAARIGIDLCRALSAIHGRNLVHRDIKPANVMRAAGGRTVLLDFGIALSPDDRAADAALGAHSGTPIAMAPEQFGGSGSAPVGPAADLYALGVLLYWAVCGRFPHAAATYAELKERTLSGRLVPLADRRPDVPARYAAILEKAMEREPARRFESAGAFERALRDFLAGADGPKAAAARPRPAAKWLAALALAALAALATFVAIASWPSAAKLELDARLFVARDGAVHELGSGDAVRVGDRLFLEVRCSRKSHVYVLNEDASGEMFAMFPAPGYEPRNPLGPGATHRLPGRFEGGNHDWVVTSSGGGGETILVLASIEPEEAVESVWRGVPAVRPESAPPMRSLDASARALLFRGIGKTAPAAAPAEGHAEPRAERLEQLAEALGRAGEKDRAARMIRLRNVR